MGVQWERGGVKEENLRNMDEEQGQQDEEQLLHSCSLNRGKRRGSKQAPRTAAVLQQLQVLGLNGKKANKAVPLKGGGTKIVVAKFF